LGKEVHQARTGIVRETIHRISHVEAIDRLRQKRIRYDAGPQPLGPTGVDRSYEGGGLCDYYLLQATFHKI